MVFLTGPEKFVTICIVISYYKFWIGREGDLPMTMTKKDIVIKVSNDTNLTQIDVKKIVQKTLDAVVESLEKGETVELRNFGVFKVKNRRGRLGRNPRTGQEVAVPEKKVVVFKPGLVLKYKVK